MKYLGNSHPWLGNRLATFLVVAGMSASSNAQVASTAFQNGLNGYNGTFDRRISDSGDESNGADSASYFLDGFSTGGSPDTQGLLRFDNIIGSGAGQIPSGATILDAKLTVNTSLAGNAQTSGPYGVSGLLQGFTETSSYFDFPGARGPWWQDGTATRPTGGFGFQLPGRPDTANITSVVQSWANGATNHGLVLQAGLGDIDPETNLPIPANTSDGWSIRTTGFPTSDTRPRLDVTYTTQSVEANSFQEGTDGHAGTKMAVVRSGTNALIEDVAAGELTEDGASLDQTFLDGVLFADTEGNTNSPDDFALIQFGDVFGNNPGQAPSDVPVAKAWAVITTGDQSTNARTSGSWSAYTMQRPWDTDTLHSSFGDVAGLQVGDGDISPALDTQDGFINGAEVYFDVTDYLEGIRNGADDYGIAISADGTADGWQIHATGSSTVDARPRLLVYSADLNLVSPGLPGDFNDDGVVDAGDYTVVIEIARQTGRFQ